MIRACVIRTLDFVDFLLRLRRPINFPFAPFLGMEFALDAGEVERSWQEPTQHLLTVERVVWFGNTGDLLVHTKIEPRMRGQGDYSQIDYERERDAIAAYLESLGWERVGESD